MNTSIDSILVITLDYNYHCTLYTNIHGSLRLPEWTSSPRKRWQPVTETYCQARPHDKNVRLYNLTNLSRCIFPCIVVINSNSNSGVPIIAVLGIGYGITALRDAQQRIQRESMQEEERLRRNAQLMDAYGDKTSLEDMQRALEHYHKVSILPSLRSSAREYPHERITDIRSLFTQ